MNKIYTIQTQLIHNILHIYMYTKRGTSSIYYSPLANLARQKENQQLKPSKTLHTYFIALFENITDPDQRAPIGAL